jgi:subtilisin
MFDRRARVARALVVATLTVVLTAGSGIASASPDTAGAAGAPGTPEAASPYIVVLRDTAAPPGLLALHHSRLLGIQVGQIFQSALHGYSAPLTLAQVDQLRADPAVAYVEPDLPLQITQTPQAVPTGIRRANVDDNPRLDVDGVDDARVDVDVAVIDTGVYDHPDLDVASRTDCSLAVMCLPGLGLDDNGHGTHVAGTIGAIDNGTGVVGVAPGARIHSVKVCNLAGTCLTSSIVAGVDYVTSQAATVEVANMSLGGTGTSQALADAITRSVDAGVVYSVSAGNDRADAAGYTPANHPDVITVSALADADGAPGGTGGTPSCRPESRDDVLADFSNFGGTVEVAAPGVCILSTWNDGGLNTISGTSMAAPHVTGAAAVIASARNPANRADVMAIRQRITSTGNFGWVDDSGDGAQEPLLDVTALP